MIKYIAFIFMFSTACFTVVGQSLLHQFKIRSPHTSFPDSGRINGHIYDSVFYSAIGHYSDSSVMIIVPKKCKADKRVDLIFWFHGWNNNIDSALMHFGLARQFAEAGVNAVLVLAETAKNAPDSYGGKLENKDEFRNLVNDVLEKLAERHAISASAGAGNIVLAGHSGAYRVMAHILQNGNLPVKTVILFDALYSQTDKFLSWIAAGAGHRFINIYTNDGGTYDETKNMVQQVKSVNIPFVSLEETDVTPAVLQNNRVIFIHTMHQHNDIMQHPDNFRLLLENTGFLEKVNR
jgi:hypothetical protein